MTERIAELIDPDEDGLRHVVWRDEVVRCRDCESCRTLPQGLVCCVHGSAGWYATMPDGFCHRARRRKNEAD